MSTDLLSVLGRNDSPETVIYDPHRSLIIEKPRHLDELNTAVVWILRQWNTSFDQLYVGLTGWWCEATLQYIAYLKPTGAIAWKLEDHPTLGSYLRVGNRDWHITTLPSDSPAYWAAEIIPHTSTFTRPIIPPAWLAAGSPVGYPITRELPGWDIVRTEEDTYRQRIAESTHQSQREPSGAIKRQVTPTSYGWLFQQPSSAITIDQVWYWLAETQGLVAERDIEAYALGWWRIDRNNQHWEAFTEPQQIWGRHAAHVYSFTETRDEIAGPGKAHTADFIWQVAYVNIAAGATASQIPHLSSKDIGSKPPTKAFAVPYR